MNDTDGPPGFTAPLVTCVPAESGASSGAITQTSCANPAVSAGKFHVTTSPSAASTSVGSHAVPAASTWCSASAPANARAADPMNGSSAGSSVADSVTLTGPV